MSCLFSCSLYFLSFLPLWLSVLFVSLKSILEHNPHLYTEYLSIGCILVFTIISSLILALELRPASQNVLKENTQCAQLLSACEEKAITAEFLLSYILPLFAFDFTQWDGVILFLIFFFVLGYLCIRHQYFCVNLVMEKAGYRFFQCQLQNDDGIQTEYVIISRRRLNGHLGEDLYLKMLNNDYALDVDH